MSDSVGTTSDTGHVPAKRPRIEEVSNMSELQRVEEFWFTDGSIVLVAEKRAFRVHQSILSKNSQVFRDLFSLAQPTEQNQADSTDGCPVVHLSDSADDVLRLLSALYDGRNYLSPNRSMKLPTVAALVRMSHKYQIDDLLEDALARIRTYFPDNFRDWETLVANGDISNAVEVRATEAITVVNLARLTNALSILPTAFYRCCQLPPMELVSGVHDADGHVVDQLTQDDLARCIGALTWLASANIGIPRRILESGGQDTCRALSCTDGIHDMQGSVVLHYESLMNKSPGYNCPLHSNLDTIRREARRHGVCNHCVKTIQRRDVKERRAFWNRLPEIFLLTDDLPEWGSSDSAAT